MSEVEIQYSPDDLMQRYGISKTTLYKRLNVLGFTPYKIGNKSYFDTTQVEMLDKLNTWVNNNPSKALTDYVNSDMNITNTNSESNDNGIKVTKLDYPVVVDGNKNQQLYLPLDVFLEKVDKVLEARFGEPKTELEKMMDNQMESLRRLEEIANHRWVISSLMLKTLIGRSIPPGSEFSYGGFKFQVVGKMGHSKAFRVSKLDF